MSAEPPSWVRPTTTGASLRVHVRPATVHTGLAGFHGDALCLRVVARPVEGQANRELLRALAEILEVPPSALEIVTGRGSREKRVEVRDLTAEAVRDRVLGRLAVDTRPRRT